MLTTINKSFLLLCTMKYLELKFTEIFDLVLINGSWTQNLLCLDTDVFSLNTIYKIFSFTCKV